MNFNVLDYWNAIKEKTGDSRYWDDLGLQNQQLIIDSINRLIQVLSTDSKIKETE